ncbi:hypothetical protein ACCO45_009632 [Purpureocillium lilacinum]|uniref:Uncharacterized protein n=1 Tax=Purpureocillium lilacinum TaxID=33203 RepID=A0ACC4DMW2_PURLI
MELGLAAELIGYAARIFSWKNQWDQNALCLWRVQLQDSPKWYTRTFIPCDVVSLCLQAVGGIIASVALQNGDSLTTGDNIMIAGLATQVFTLLVFITLCADFALQVRRRQRQLGADVALTQEPGLVKIRTSWQFKGFMAGLGLATILIFWRSAYRVAELNQGWTGPITFNQGLFTGMEPVLITVAVYALVIFHPSFCLGEAMGERKLVPYGSKSGSQNLAQTEGDRTPESPRAAPVDPSQAGDSEPNETGVEKTTPQGQV